MDEHLEADYEDRQNFGTDLFDVEAAGEELSDLDEEDYEPDWEAEERKRDFLEFSRNHPDMAFTGASVQDHIYNGGDLESASDDPIDPNY